MAWIVILVALPAALAILPVETIESGPRVCLFYNLTGHPCLGCGMTRAVASALHGDFMAAYRFNPRIVVAGPLLMLLWIKTIKDTIVMIQTHDQSSATSPADQTPGGIGT